MPKSIAISVFTFDISAINYPCLYLGISNIDLLAVIVDGKSPS